MPVLASSIDVKEQKHQYLLATGIDRKEKP